MKANAFFYTCLNRILCTKFFLMELHFKRKKKNYFRTTTCSIKFYAFEEFFFFWYQCSDLGFFVVFLKLSETLSRSVA